VSEQRGLDWFSRRVRATAPIRCAECGAVCRDDARGWRAIRSGELDLDDTPELFFFCPAGAEREFGT
jgi:hypothetical protein